MNARSQAGQVLAYVAVVAPLLLLPLVAYAVESTRVAAAQARLQGVAVAAAEDGVQQIDSARFRAGGGLGPDPVAAQSRVSADVRAVEPAASVDAVSVSGAAISVALSEPVPLVFAGLLGPAAVTVHAGAGASLQAGY
jgi:hypothetical protein